MSHRKAIEPELKKFELLANKLDNNLKNVTQSLVDERNRQKGEFDAMRKDFDVMKTLNVELKVKNDCMSDNQKLYEKLAFHNHDQSFVSKFVEAATKYAGDREADAAPENHTPRSRNSLQSPTFVAPYAPSTAAATAAYAAPAVHADADADDIEYLGVMDAASNRE